MELHDALRHYRRDRLSDEDVTGCTGLSVRAWRELIKLGAVRTVTERRGRGHVRLCDATTLKRAAVIAALNRAGLSFAVAGRIAYFFPFHTVMFAVCDPILLQPQANVDSTAGRPPRVQWPACNWFDPDKPADADVTDWRVDIFDGRFVAARYGDDIKQTLILFGDLRQGATRFVGWRPFPQRNKFTGGAIGAMARHLLPARFVAFVEDWENAGQWRTELKLLDYEFEQHNADDDPLCLEAEATANSPLFQTTVNVTLAIRKALRRYLHIEPGATAPGQGDQP